MPSGNRLNNVFPLRKVPYSTVLVVCATNLGLRTARHVENQIRTLCSQLIKTERPDEQEELAEHLLFLTDEWMHQHAECKATAA